MLLVSGATAPTSSTGVMGVASFVTLTVVFNHSNRICTFLKNKIINDNKRSEIVDLQLTNQIPDLLYLTIPTLPYNCNKYCDPIGHSEARDCDKRSEIVDLQLTNHISDLLYPTIPYNTYITV